MAGVHGERMYGYVDRVPGLCHVATQFFHFNFVPIFPLGSYLIQENAPVSQGIQGRRIGMSLKSVLVGYFRGWVGLATIVLFAICAIQAGETILDGQANDLAHVLVFGGLTLVYGCVWWAMLGSHKSWILAWLVVLAATGGYFWWDSANPVPPKPANPFKAPAFAGRKHREELPTLLLSANGCLFALAALRSFDNAGRAKAYELGELLGLSEDDMDEIWARRTGHAEEPSPPDNL